MTQVHIVDALVAAGFSKTQVRRHRVFTRTAVIANAYDAKYTMLVAPPLAGEEYWNVNIYECGPREIRNSLPVEKETAASLYASRPKYWCVVRNLITNFLNNN
jgi:hypothetical protein